MATSVKLDEDLQRRIQRLAERRRRSAHWIMREAIEVYVSREEARQSFLDEAEASWAAFRETGRHLTEEEVAAWLDGWGSAGEKAPPDCHD